MRFAQRDSEMLTCLGDGMSLPLCPIKLIGELSRCLWLS